MDRKDFQNVSKRDKKKRELIYMLDDTIVYSQKYFKRKLWDEKRKNKRRDECFKIREEFIGLIRIFASEVIGNRDCYLRTIESGTQRDPL